MFAAYLNFAYNFPGGLEFLQRLARCDGVDHDECVSFGNVESLHGRELVRARRVGDLQRAHIVLVASYHLNERP